MAETRLTASSPASVADKKQEKDGKLDPAQNSELLSYLASIQQDQLPVNEALSNMAARQVEQTATTAAWTGVAQSLLVPSKLDSELERRRFEDLQQQLALIVEEKKKQRKGLDGREGAVFEKLVSILGQPLAEQIALKIDKAITGQGAALQKDPTAVAKLSAELLSLLSSGDTLLKLGIAPQEAERSLKQCFAALERSFAHAQTVPANRPDGLPTIGNDIVATAKIQPQIAVAHLKTQAGVDLLRANLAAQTNPESRIEMLRSLQLALGPERFSVALDSYDRLTGRPLVFDCLQLSATVETDQRKILQTLLDPSRTILGSAQLERLSQFVISDAAAVMQILKVEYAQIPQQIGNVERLRSQSYVHLASVLGIETPSGLSADASREQFLQAIVVTFPRLAGKSWEDVSKALFELAGSSDIDAFKLAATKLGWSLPHAKPGSLSSGERMQAYQAAQGEIKELAVRLLTHMNDISGHERQLVELRAMLAAGPEQEEAKVMARLEALYSGLISGFSREKVTGQGEASRIYIEGLHARIEATIDPVALQALCVERDSLQWRALQLRITTLLEQQPAAVERVSALLLEFQTAYPTGIRGRSAEFFQASEDVLQALQTTTEYFQQVDRAFSAELQKLTEEQVSLDKKQQELEGLVKTQQAVVDKYVTSWFNNYAQDKKHLEELKHSLQETEQRQKAVEDYIGRTKAAHTEVLAQQVVGLSRVATTGLHDVAGLSPGDVAARCVLTRESSEVQEALQAKLLAADEARTRAQNILTRVELVGRAACTRQEFATGASAATARMQQILLHDRAMQPAPAALQALRTAVPADTSLGKALASIVSSSRPAHELIDLLFARLSPDDVMRVKAFLFAYDRPELFELVGRVRPVNAQSVWNAIAALGQSDQKQEVSELLVALPQLRILLDCQELLASQPEGQRQGVLLEYQRLAGGSLGQILLARAPANEPARSNYLFALCGSPITTSEDLRALFPAGNVPVEAAERQRAFAQALKRDGQIQFALPAEFEELIQQQAGERAGLQVALSTMIQLNRDGEVEKIRRRLAELDSQFYRPLQTLLAGYSADYLARTGIRQRLEGARDAATQMSKMSLVDPYGDLAQDARKLAQVIQRDDVSPAQVLEFIRESSQSPERMMLLEVTYQQYVSSRPFIGLSGDLRQDVGRKKGAERYDQEQYDRLLAGEPGALASYDLEMLSRGLRTKDPALTGRAMLAIQSKEFGKESLRAAIEQTPEMKRLWQEYVQSPNGREAWALYNSVMTNDQARIALIRTVNGLAWSMDKGIDTIASLGQYKDEAGRLGSGVIAGTEDLVREIYGASFGQVVVRYVGEISGVTAQMWSGFVNGDAGAQTKACLAFVQQSLDQGTLDPARLVDLIYMIPVEHRGAALAEMDEFVAKIEKSAIYQDGRNEAVLIEYIRQKGGAIGEADAAFMKVLAAEAAGTGPALSPEVVRRYQIERERLASQLEDIATLGTIRGGTLDQAMGFRTTVGSMNQAAQVDLDGRMFGRNRAQVLINTHASMLSSQDSLIRGMQLGFRDIQSTKEVMRVRAVAILKDLAVDQDRGLSSTQNDRDFGALRQRDMEHEWAVARRSDVKRWQTESEVAQKALANFDWWFEVGHSTLKVAAIIGLGMVPGVGPLTILGVATAWNVADKAYRVAYRGVSLREAVRQFAVEFAIDAMCVGAWKLAARVPTPWFKHTARFAQNNVAVKHSKIFLGKLKGFNPKGEWVKPEVFKNIKGWFGQTRLAKGVEKIAEKALNAGNAKLADPSLLADTIKYSFKRVWIPFRPSDLLRLAPTLMSRPSPVVPAPNKGEEPELLVGGVAGGARKGASSNQEIPALNVQVANKPLPDQISELLERATRLGNDKVADLSRQVLDASKGGDTEKSLALMEGWMRELGTKFSGQGPEVLLKELQGMIDATRAGERDLSSLYPYVAPLMFLLGINPSQLEKSSLATSSPNDWKDYSSNFALFDGMFKFLSPGWAGLWISYTDNASSFAPPPPPVQPPPPPYLRRPGNSGGSGADGAPGLTLQVAADGQKRKPIGEVESKVDRDDLGRSQTQAQARANSQELADRRAQEQTVAAIEQALQAQRAAVTHAHSIRQRLENVDQDKEQVPQQQGVVAPTIKAAALQGQVHESGVTAPQSQSQAIHLEDAAVEGRAVNKSQQKANARIEQEDVISVALRSREIDAPKMAVKPSKLEQVSIKKQENTRTEDGELPHDEQSSLELHAKNNDRSMRDVTRVEMEQTAALRQTRDQLALQRAVQGPRQSLGTLNPTALNDKTDSRAVSTEIDASALSHHEVTAGVPSQQADTTFDASYVIEPKAHDEMGDSSDSDSGNPRAAKRKRKNKLQLREEARLREIIMHQLLTQTLERAKREKLLRMLAALGMTEQEYRSFLTRLHAADAKREEAAKIQEAHKIALAVEVPPQSAAPTMKPDAPKSVSSDGSSPRTRAELFARLRNQREDKVH